MESAPARPTRWETGLFLTLLAAAVFLAYSDALTGPYLFDDTYAIPGNPTIRHLGTAFLPPTENGNTVGGRPFLNLSLALNYAVNRALLGDGLETAGYHAVNVLIHLAAAALLYGLLWRTLRRTASAPLAHPVAAGAALLWAVHPVQTEAVTYIVQRAESLAGALILLSLYAFVRGTDEEAQGGRPRAWLAASVAAAALGMATKETAAVLPLLAWLHARAFPSGGEAPGTGLRSLLAPLRRRPGYFLALASTWLVLLLCLALNPGRGNTAGFEIAMPWWLYGLSQFHSLAHYLRLVAWPHPLLFDYGTGFVPPPPEFLRALPWIALMLPVLGGALYAAWRHPKAGYAGVWFFLILAPSSSVVPLFDPVWEHRLYLSLAAPLALLALFLYRTLGKKAALPLALLVCLAAGATFARNLVWRDEVVFWADSVAKSPENKRSRNNLGTALCRVGRLKEAEAQLRRACALDAAYTEAWNNLGTVFYLDGPSRYAEAEAAFRRALLLKPDYVDARNNLGTLLLTVGKTDAAWTEFAAASRLAPRRPEAFLSIGFLCLRIGRPVEAMDAFGTVLRLVPDHPRAHAGLGIALDRLHRTQEAAWHLQRALQLNPRDAEARRELDSIHLPPGPPGA